MLVLVLCSLLEASVHFEIAQILQETALHPLHSCLKCLVTWQICLQLPEAHAKIGHCHPWLRQLVPTLLDALCVHSVLLQLFDLGAQSYQNATAEAFATVPRLRYPTAKSPRLLG